MRSQLALRADVRYLQMNVAVFFVGQAVGKDIQFDAINSRVDGKLNWARLETGTVLRLFVGRATDATKGT